MKFTFVLFLVILNTCALVLQGRASEPVDFVDPFIGTAQYKGLSKWGREGGTYPGAVVPWGMIQISPETRLDAYPPGYYFEDDTIYFFSLYDHLSGYPGGSSGMLRMMPVNGIPINQTTIPKSAFSHENEEASPGYYRVFLEDYGIDAECTATAHGGFLRLTFTKTGEKGLILMDAIDLDVENMQRLTGRWGPLYCIIESEKPFSDIQKTSKGHFLVFADSGTGSREQLLRFAFSEVSQKGAAGNLRAELNHWDFGKTRKEARTVWNAGLNRISLQGGMGRERTIFYTALYHSMLLPYRNTDSDGRYRGADGKNHRLRGEHNYAVFSPWDTFRTLHPLLTLLFPSVQKDMLRSLVRIYEHTGRLPARPMTGNHAIPIIVDSYFKGITDFDIHKAYEGMRDPLLVPSRMRTDMKEYDQLGFVPAENPGSVTRTLEYAYNDWVMAQMARELNKEGEYENLLNRSFNYRNVFNPSERFMQPRNRDGSRAQMGGFREGDKWTYSWFVPHNVRDLINLMGGSESFSSHLDQAFSEGHYIHDNEPPLHYAWLFNFAGKPWLTQYWVRHIMKTCYSAEAGGIPGNDDHGSMSSWYVFSALGLYPVCPGRPEYLLNSPLFEQATLHLENGREFRINASGQGDEPMYIRSARLNGSLHDRSYLSHDALLDGGELKFVLGGKPDTTWATDLSAQPLSESVGKPEFVFHEWHVSDSVVEAHQPVSAEILIENTGASGSREIRLYIDEKLHLSKRAMLHRGERERFSLPFRLYRPGSHTVRLNTSENRVVTVVDREPRDGPVFKTDKLQLTPLVRFGNALPVDFTVQNISTRFDTIQVAVTLNDRMHGSVKTGLEPGETRTLHYSIRNLPSGMHRIRVADMPYQRVKVYQHPLESSVLHLTFDDGAGRIIEDISGFNNTGHLIGSVQRTVAKYGWGIQTGEEGYAEIPLTPSLELTGSTITMMFWFYPMDEGQRGRYRYSYADILTQGDHNVLKMQNPWAVSFSAGGWGRGQCIARVPGNWNRNWHHLAGVRDENTMRLYIDGKVVDIKNIESEIDPTPFPWNLGRNAEYTRGRSVNGIIDDVRIYKEPLDTEDIRKAMLE